MDFLKELTKAGITSTSDGLLRDFIAHGQLQAALGALKTSVERREAEIEFLLIVLTHLIEEIGE